jgi:hypothetical protein
MLSDSTRWAIVGPPCLFRRFPTLATTSGGIMHVYRRVTPVHHARIPPSNNPEGSGPRAPQPPWHFAAHPFQRQVRRLPGLPLIGGVSRAPRLVCTRVH